MILDRIENATLYSALNSGFSKAFEVLRDKTLAKKEDGKYTVDGDKIYYTIQHYTTKPIAEGKLEAHRKYIDIQFLLAGEELLGYAPLKGSTVAEEYNHQKDIAFFHTPDEITKVKLEPGLFCILFPDDAHLPCCHLTGPSEVRKVVVKIRL
ncbi:MAG: YhcH/YjgK/YiaL family protein [Sedimentisphaerales bacterium]|nr:YhcH/YjgK/YiaL family protein [Sedimentisphaerales bacterium]